MSVKEKMYDRIRGVLYGVAVGDCLGAPAEFRDRAEIAARFGEIRDIVPGSIIGARLGCGTDDTAMTLAVAEGIMKCKPGENPVRQIGAEFVRWFCGEPIGLGGTCGRAIEFASKYGRIKSPSLKAWAAASEMTHYQLKGRSGGNGTLMRTAPIALFYTDEAERDSVAYGVSKMTHWDEDAATACILYCEIISKLIQGQKLEDAVSCLKESRDYNETVTDPQPTGYVKDTFKTALWGWFEHNSFESILINVVNLGGDADTTGAIVGGLAGAEFGYSAIPDRWIKALDGKLKARLDAAAEAAGKVWGCGT